MVAGSGKGSQQHLQFEAESVGGRDEDGEILRVSRIGAGGGEASSLWETLVDGGMMGPAHGGPKRWLHVDAAGRPALVEVDKASGGGSSGRQTVWQAGCC